MPKTVILCSNIASGKSLLLALAKDLGIKTIDADKEAHAILDANCEEIARIFGPDFVENKRVKRDKLGSLVFKDSLALDKLNSLMQERISSFLREKAKESRAKGESLLIELGVYFEHEHLYDFHDEVIFIKSSKADCLKRALDRGLSAFKFEDIWRVQTRISPVLKASSATWVIENKGFSQMSRAEFLAAAKLLLARVFEL